MAHTLILLRHGESEWNAKNLFTGWVDVALTEKGRGEAVRGGEQLKAAGLLPDVVHTSLQRRAINTAAMALNRSEEHTSELQSLMRISYAVFCLKKKTLLNNHRINVDNKTNKTM